MPSLRAGSAAVHDAQTATARVHVTNGAAAARHASDRLTGAEPVLELVGWNAEPLLLKRLVLHVAEAFAEAIALGVGIVIVKRYLILAGLVSRLLVMPLGVVLLKLLWALRLSWGHHRLGQAKDFATALRRLGQVHTRNFWIFSAGFFICFSCILMMWYAILLLLMTSYEYRPEETTAVRYVIFLSLTFGLVNWAFWRDFVRNCKDESPEDEESPEALNLRLLFQMYRKRAIRVRRYSELTEAQLDEFPVAPPTECTICLEQFADKDDIAQLPCGHIFHPACAHRWIREDWRCPFRCSLQPEKLDPPKSLTDTSPTNSSTAHAVAPMQLSGEDAV